MWIPIISTYGKCINATHMHGHLIIHVSFTFLHEIFNAFSPKTCLQLPTTQIVCLNLYTNTTTTQIVCLNLYTNTTCM